MKRRRDITVWNITSKSSFRRKQRVLLFSRRWRELTLQCEQSVIITKYSCLPVAVGGTKGICAVSETSSQGQGASLVQGVSKSINEGVLSFYSEWINEGLPRSCVSLLPRRDLQVSMERGLFQFLHSTNYLCFSVEEFVFPDAAGFLSNIAIAENDRICAVKETNQNCLGCKSDLCSFAFF